ncbi:MAG: TerC/Alx family metal homeostasis membrane protein [Candidatus Kapabacteria bacterium]|nr:TerC/Alx family metal homeostasis membrane protein [Ignavibacteriota bacterium]MCW5885707.1 TerC/Alx family metal homeostasis membrane protein [Candidatus Kapabacteria bacterium]
MSELLLLIFFGVIVLIMLVIDLGVFNKTPHKVSSKEALIWTIVWVLVALAFSWFIYYNYGGVKTTQYITAYLIEKSLSVDNLFVFVLIFAMFKVPEIYQHKVLYWGIIGAIIFRAIFIFTGVWLINLTYLPEMEVFGILVKLNPILIFFGFFLIFAGIKTLRKHESLGESSENTMVKIIKKFIPVSGKFDEGKFFTKIDGKWLATPLFVCVAVIEMTDVVFAIDSIPAIFGISKDPIILYTSNIFALLGLRALYFLLANSMNKFKYLKYGLGLVLSYIGLKMLVSEFYHIDSIISLIVVGSILVLSILPSIIYKSDS